MQTRLIAITLFAATAATIGGYPLLEAATEPPQPGSPLVPTNNRPAHQQAQIDVVFVLDTTGSMGGMIAAAKEKIWSIASSMATGEPAPIVRMGLVAFRDRGDAYVTQVHDLSADMDSVYATLMQFRAEGGGDGPESVNQALHDALDGISWSRDDNAYKVIFLVGDAPPHMDYRNEARYPELLDAAGKRNIVVNAVQCGDSPATRKTWQHIARLGGGAYFSVDQQGSALTLSSPFDAEIAALSEKLDATRLYYGDAEQKEKQQRKLQATEKLHSESSVESRARRAAYNLSKSGTHSLLGENELVDEVTSGRVELRDIDSDDLPAAMQTMAPDAREKLITEKAQERDALRGQLETLTRQREAHLKRQVDEIGGSEASLGHKIQRAVRAQAAKLGIEYGADSMRY